MKLYLAHPFDCRKWVREWELALEAWAYDIELVNPFYDNPERDMSPIDQGDVGRYECDPTEIVNHDLALIQFCDGLIAIIDNDPATVSYGTIMEIVYASRICFHPVYLIVLNGHEEHPWLRYHADKIFTSLMDFELWYEENH